MHHLTWAASVRAIDARRVTILRYIRPTLSLIKKDESVSIAANAFYL